MPWFDKLRDVFTHKPRDVQPPPATPTSTATTDAPKVKSNTTVNQPIVDATSRVTSPSPKAKEIAAVKELRRLVEAGELSKYYDAVIDVVDNPELKAKAMALFESLPKINGRVRAEELVALGLWTVAPRGIEAMQKSPRYLPGRRLLVPTSLNPDIFAGGNKFLTYLSPEEGGKPGVTSRAVLVGEKGNDFLVKVDGREELVAVAKREVYKYNHPTTFEQRGNPDLLEINGGGSSFGRTDYSDPLTKAKVCEAAIKMDAIVGKIDFTKALTGNVMGKSAEAKEIVRLQQAAVGAVHQVINMTYYHGEQDEEGMKAQKRPHAAYVSTGRAAIKGTGKCHDHACVNLGLLTPFAAILGVDMKMFYGHCYRGVERYRSDEKLPSDIVKSDLLKTKDGDYLFENPFEFHPQRTRDPTTKEILDRKDPMTGKPIIDPRTGKPKKAIESTGHSWIHLSFRPALNDERVCDQTWGQPNKEADAAYTTRWGDRYPTRSWFIPALQEIQPTDSNFTGDLTVDTPGVIFGKQGDGREAHIGYRRV